MRRSHSVCAQVDLLIPGKPAVAQHLHRLRRCVELHTSGDGTALSAVGDLPSILKDNTHYVPAEAAEPGDPHPDAATLQWSIKMHMPMHVHVLWPALQQPPLWLRTGFEEVKGAEVKVRWSFSFQQRAWLNITNQRKRYQEQVMLVWRMPKHLSAGAQIQLPGPNITANSRTAGFAAPEFSHIVCLRTLSNTPGLLAGVGGSKAAALAAKLMHSTETNPANCSLQQIYTGLEEGTFDPTTLNREGADDLLNRAMLAGHDELLSMLIEEGMGEHCSQPRLQLLLRYCMMEGLPWLAELVLLHTNAELTRSVLQWFVRELLAARSLADAEQLLAAYCMSRKNPLSGIAAVKQSLIKAGAARFGKTQEALHIAAKFRAAKHDLIHQLLQGSARQQDRQQCCTQDCRQEQQRLSLQAVLQQCLMEKEVQGIGRGISDFSASIHDSSPYTIAVRMHDAELLSVPAVLEYTARTWQGTELSTMENLLNENVLINSMTVIVESTVQKLPRSTRRSRASLTGCSFASTSSPVSGAPGCCIGNVSEAYLSGRGANDSGDRVTAWQAGNGSDLANGSDGSQGQGQGQAADGSCFLAVQQSQLQLASGAGFRSQTSQPGGMQGSSASLPGPHAVEVGSLASRSSSNAPATRHSKPALKSPGAVAPPAAAFASVSCQWLSPGVGLELLQNMGFADKGSQPFARGASALVHIVLLAPRALYNSPRGRWMLRCLFELLFLIFYQVAVMGNVATVPVLIVLPILVIGNIVDIVFQVHFQFRNSLWRFLAHDHWSKLDVAVNVGLLGVLLISATRLVHLGGDVDSKHVTYNAGHDAVHGLDSVWVVASAFAVLIWARALGIITPLSARLGAMLYTLRRAAEEAAFMVPLLVVLMIGFGTSLTVVYTNVAPEYSTLAGSLRMLVGATGGDLNLLEFEEYGAGNPLLVVWGQAVMIVYVIVVNVLCMTMLIAIINQTYHPETQKDETVVMHAEAVLHYHAQVRCGLVCSPANVLQLLLLWLPHGYRTRLLPARCMRLGIPPLDGFAPSSAAVAATPDLLIATGPAEIGYLCFLLTLQPLLSVLAVVAFLLHIPVGVVHFATKGHLMWLESSWAGDSARHQEAAVAGGSGQVKATADRVPSAGTDRSCGAQELHQHLNAAGAAAAPKTASGAKARRASLLVLGRTASTVEAAMVAAAAAAGAGSAELRSQRSIFDGRSWLSVQGGFEGCEQAGLVPVGKAGQVRRWRNCISSNAFTASCRARWLALTDIVGCVGAVLLAAVVGLLAHVILLVLLVVLLCWAWITRLVFSVYCIFIPAAANTRCCLNQSRQADFWTKADVQAAFAAAMIGGDGGGFGMGEPGVQACSSLGSLGSYGVGGVEGIDSRGVRNRASLNSLSSSGVGNDGCGGDASRDGSRPSKASYQRVASLKDMHHIQNMNLHESVQPQAQSGASIQEQQQQRLILLVDEMIERGQGCDGCWPGLNSATRLGGAQEALSTPTMQVDPTGLGGWCGDRSSHNATGGDRGVGACSQGQVASPLKQQSGGFIRQAAQALPSSAAASPAGGDNVNFMSQCDSPVGSALAAPAAWQRGSQATAVLSPRQPAASNNDSVSLVQSIAAITGCMPVKGLAEVDGIGAQSMDACLREAASSVTSVPH